jgi:hypothetical protein
MGVETSPLETSYNRPSDDLPASQKGAEWCMQNLRWMYTEATTRQYAKIFFAARDDYRKFKEYALSAQSVLPYRKWLTGSESNDKTWVNINWTIPTIGTKYRNILVNKLLARKYNITCTPIDPLAVDNTNKRVAGMKAKVLLTEAAKKINPSLLKTNTLTKKTGDPEDMEDLQMRGQLGFKFELAMDAELGIQVLFNQNRIKQERKMVIEDLVDLGIGIYKDWIDENDQVRFERVNPINFICNYCRRGDFKDMDFGAQMKWMTLGELTPFFTNEELHDMAVTVAGRNGNPRTVPYNFSQADYDKFKVMVMDGEWLSYNADVYKRDYDGRGNYSFKKKAKLDPRKGPEREDSSMQVDVNGKLKPKFERDDCQVVYKGMWVVDTEYVFNYGLATDQIRKKGTDWRKTRISFHCYAPDFYEMKALGVVERMVPFIDDYCRTWYKIQNFFNRWIPYIVNIDLAAIENIPLGKGGVRLKHMEVLDMLFQTFILPTRQKSAITGMNEPNKPVTIEATQMAEEITVLLQNLQTALTQIRAVTGLNEVVDGTGPAERTNVPAQQQAQQGSNNAIAHFQTADSMLLEDLSESLLMRLQRVLKRGKKVSGYINSLGANAIKFAQISPDISLHEYAIELEDQPDDDMKQMLLQQLSIQDQKGLILPEDYFTIVNMTNLKEMELKLIYTSKKRQQAAQQDQMAQQQGQAQANAQASVQIETAKQDTIKAKGEEDRKTADVVGSWQVKAAEVKAKVALDAETVALMKEIALEAMNQFHENGQGFGAPGGPGGPQQQPSGGQPGGIPQPGQGVAPGQPLPQGQPAGQ